MNTAQEDKPRSNSRPLALSLESKSSSLSPRYSQTAQTSPPSTATFGHGRDPRPVLDVSRPGLEVAAPVAAEESDEDLRNYRQDVETEASGEKADARRPMGPLARSVDPDARHQDPADRVARALLAQEFAVFPRSPQPPIPVLQAISKCLDDVSLSVRSARSLGFLPPSMTANPSAEAIDKNNDDDDIQDDPSEDGSGISPRFHFAGDSHVYSPR
ncbi:hypothetical protein B0T25DRAFT_563983 [Lasiosphaeria hispida]|uniref:Uncharacterized protein n=1 Tax=Lasiosphaeria hispida TaxID=260671 RepID=A0AAJ0MH58_9PEZI|nr:hypothetical protein B0T25DRAFT_563983 [Lasiosphaeria hispida]